MAGKKVSIRDVAAAAEVSIATVSNVLSGAKSVAPVRQARVRSAAATLGYQVDRAASRLRSGRTRVIAVLVPDLTDTFFATIVSRLEERAVQDGYDVVVATSRDDPAIELSRIETLLGWRPEGVIAVPCTGFVPASLLGRNHAVPTVLIDRVAERPGAFDTVTIDNHDAGEVAARHLLELGHRDIVLAASRLCIAPIRERVEGAAALILSHSGRRPGVIELGTTAKAAGLACTAWLERNPVPGAFIALTNVTTLGVLSALAAHRIALPDRTSLVAFDDDDWMSARNTGLTAIRQPVAAIADTAWTRLLTRIGGDRTPAQATVLTASLMVRASVSNRAAAPRPVSSPRPASTSRPSSKPPSKLQGVPRQH